MNICPICQALYWDGPYPHKCAPVWVAVSLDAHPVDNYIDMERETSVSYIRAHAADDAAEQAARQLDYGEEPSESRFVGVIEKTVLEDVKHRRQAMKDTLMPTSSFEWFDVAGEVSITYRARSVPI